MNEDHPVPEKYIATNKRVRRIAGTFIAAAFIFLLGLGSGYLISGQDEIAALRQQREIAQIREQVNPEKGYALTVSYGDLGPRLIEGGAIHYDAFAALYENNGNPLSADQVGILKNGSGEQIVIDAENAHFLLNFFWAVGLANRNPILTEGAMAKYGGGQIENFASTGGWTLASKPVTEIYAGMDLIPLTAEQQALVEQVASAAYRPCCDNPTIFPDCNHGMAQLGLLELMASRDASEEQMFEAAKYANAFWFPQQNLEMAVFLKENLQMDFKDASARMITSAEFSSGSGFAAIRQNLRASGLLPQAPQQGGSCAN